MTPFSSPGAISEVEISGTHASVFIVGAVVVVVGMALRLRPPVEELGRVTHSASFEDSWARLPTNDDAGTNADMAVADSFSDARPVV